ncbi:hypothetical protein GMST_00480 [Geomonas silvestris]|uniref:TonB-dependent receptor n=1 Tax=Geomonas silvestris TaxID=2740184 RepID=A0A6V8MD33_9BACT|nr:TonB-dependent receptor [Geomonas silvestris]GFO57723.1 hypothetical protein GMST_00480 [Geomonas silvestris]
MVTSNLSAISASQPALPLEDAARGGKRAACAAAVGSRPLTRSGYLASQWCRTVGTLFCGALVLLLLSAPNAFAYEGVVDELSELGLDELLKIKVLKVYGVSRYEQDAHEAPAQVTVVDAEEIRRHDYRLLSDLLKGVAGLYVTDDRNYRYLGYRGFSVPSDYNTRVLIMIDGVRLNDEVYHQAPIGFDFPLDLRLVERVEIVRGPSQAIYGNNAFLLVINVITRIPPGVQKTETELAGDSTGAFSARATVGGPVSQGGGGLLVSGSYYDAPGSDLYLPAFDTPTTNNGVARNADFARGGSAFLKYNNAKFSLLGGYLRNLKGIPTGAWGTTFNDIISRTEDERFFGDISYHAVESPAGALKLRAYLNGYNYSGSYSYRPVMVSYDHSHSTTLGAEVVGNLVLPANHILAAGIDYRRGLRVEQGDSGGFRDDRTVDEVGLFVQDEYRPFQPLILTGSLRYDRLSRGLDSLSPKAAVVWLPTSELALKYLFGRSFRAPNAYEHYYSAEPYRANPDLREEVMYSHELVADLQLEGPWRATVTGFQYEYQGLITTYVDADGFFRLRNAGTMRSRGVETEISGRYEDWSGGLGYTYQNSLLFEGSTTHPPNSPHHLAKLHLSREFLARRVVLSGELQYTSRIGTLTPGASVAPYLLANLSLLVKDLAVKGLDLSLSIRNLFDTAYQQPGGNENLPVSGIPQEGISAGVRATYRF